MTDCSSCDVSSDTFSKEKKKDETKTRKDARIQLRDLVVWTFSSNIKGIFFSLPENCLIADVKLKAGEHLNLDRISLEMFGVFVGSLKCPTKHIPDEATVGDHTEFSLQRILLWCGSEMLLTRYDNKALDLLYWEMKHIFSGKDKLVKNAKPSDKVSYVDRVHKWEKHYWRYYYRIPNCTLSSQLVNEDCLVRSGASIQIALGLETLSILDTNREVITCFKWQQVGAVMMEAKTKNLIKFRVGNQIVTVIDKHRGEYLFSLAIYIIKMNEEKFGTRSPHRIVPDCIHGYLVFFNDACYVSALKSSHETRGSILEDLVMQSPLKLDEIKKRVEFYEELWQDAEGEMELHEECIHLANAAIDDHIRDGDTQDEDDDHRNTQDDEEYVDVVGHVEEIEQDLQEQFGDSQDEQDLQKQCGDSQDEEIKQDLQKQCGDSLDEEIEQDLQKQCGDSLDEEIEQYLQKQWGDSQDEEIKQDLQKQCGDSQDEEIEQDLQKQCGDSQDDKKCVGHDHIVEDGRKTEEKDRGVQNIKDQDNEKENVMPTT